MFFYFRSITHCGNPFLHWWWLQNAEYPQQLVKEYNNTTRKGWSSIYITNNVFIVCELFLSYWRNYREIYTKYLRWRYLCKNQSSSSQLIDFDRSAFSILQQNSCIHALIHKYITHTYSMMTTSTDFFLSFWQSFVVSFWCNIES